MGGFVKNIVKLGFSRYYIRGNIKKMSQIDPEGYNLSRREQEILSLLLTELPLKEIASTMKISYSGAYFHTQNVYRKLGIKSRMELLVKFSAEKER